MNYKVIYQSFPHPINTILTIIWGTFLILISYLLADKYLMTSLTNIIAKLNLNSDIAGIFFLNLANGIPDLITSLVVANKDVVGVLYVTLGSFVFMITMVLGVCILSSNASIEIRNSIFYKNISFIFITFSYLLFIIGAEKMTFYTTGTMLATYFIFFIYTFKMKLYESIELPNQRAQHRRKTLLKTIRNIFLIPIEIILNILVAKPNSYYQYCGLLSPVLNFTLIILYWGIKISLISFLAIMGVGLILGILLFFVIKRQKALLFLHFYGFIISGIYLYITSSELLNTFEIFEEVLRFPPGVFLITFVSWGNCIGDLITGIAASKKGLCKTVSTSIMTAPIHNILFNFSIIITYLMIKEKLTVIYLSNFIYQVMVCIAMITITLMVIMFNYEARNGKLGVELAGLLILIYSLFFLFCFV
ncbi:Cation/calcium exchanger 1 [Astathelohania contejeani]|uniref:Cation/calcium exchanger 1 n=1 Tax=Astathelohania contejeani TaxID=164912 RepID=A0ABQ7HXM9_9MICR|nr:Cation/calcium exchanger 1 [Thelohania contejeani]